MKAKIVMKWEEYLPMVPPAIDKTVPGGELFSMKVAKAERDLEKAIEAHGISKAENADEVLEKAEEQFKARCAALTQERAVLMGKVPSKNAPIIMHWFDLNAKTSGPESRKHNATVAEFGGRVLRAMKGPQDALFNALKAVGHGTDASFRRVNLAGAACEKRAAAFMPEYAALLKARNQLNKKSKYVINTDSKTNKEKVIKI